MKTISLRAKADEEGILKVELPTGTAGAEYEVVVVLQPAIQHETQNGDEVPPPGTAARMAYEAQRANIHFEVI